MPSASPAMVKGPRDWFGGQSRRLRISSGPLWIDSQICLMAVCIYHFLGVGCIVLNPPKPRLPDRPVPSGKPGMGARRAPKKIIMYFHVNWGHASAQKTQEGASGFGRGEYASVELCGWSVGTLRRAPFFFIRLPMHHLRVPPRYSCSAKKCSLVSRYWMTLLPYARYVRTRSIPPSYPPTIRILRKFGAPFVEDGLGFSGNRKSIQMDEGGEREGEIRADLCSERRIQL